MKNETREIKARNGGQETIKTSFFKKPLNCLQKQSLEKEE